MKTIVFAALVSAAQPQPHTNGRDFDFDGFNATSEVTFDNPALTRCQGSPENGSCALVRHAIGDVAIYGGIVEIKRRRVFDIMFGGATKEFSRAVETLIAKYGEPTSRQTVENGRGGYIRVVDWTFNDGLLGISSDTEDASFYGSFINRTNPDPKVAPAVDF